jgi:hypothetical protein
MTKRNEKRICGEGMDIHVCTSLDVNTCVMKSMTGVRFNRTCLNVFSSQVLKEKRKIVSLRNRIYRILIADL